MPINDPPEEVLQGALDMIETIAYLEIADAANIAQMEIDSFMRSQGVALTRLEIQGIISDGQTTVARNAIEKLRREIMRVLGDSVNSAWGAGKNAQQATRGAEVLWTWMVESGKPCPDCAPRSGLRKSYAEWATIGLPQSGFSVCGKNCKCTLYPPERVGDFAQGHLNIQRRK